MTKQYVVLGNRETTPATCGPACTTAGECTCGAGEGWAPDSCALAEADRPAREREFATLFAEAVRSASRPAPTRLELLLDPAFADRAKDLAARESGCCSFFDFTFTDTPPDLTWTIEVPTAQIETLDALAATAPTIADR